MLMDYAVRVLAAVFDFVARNPTPAASTNLVHVRHQAVVDAVVRTDRTTEPDDPDLPPATYRHDAISDAADRLIDLHAN